MNVSKRFLRDFAYVANLYEWLPEDIEDAKAQTRADPENMKRYWTNLARAHRAGYPLPRQPGYTKLAEWCYLHGLPNPYADYLPEVPCAD